MIVIVPPLNKTINRCAARDCRKANEESFNHTPDVWGDASDEQIFIIQTHKISLTPSPPNSGSENEGMGTLHTSFKPIILIHVREKNLRKSKKVMVLNVIYFFRFKLLIVLNILYKLKNIINFVW